MDKSYKTNLQKTVSEIFPVYLQKELLNQAVNESVIINNKKKTAQLSLNFTGILDVSECDSVEEKIDTMMQTDSVLKFIEEFEYRRQYRHFCYFKCSDIAFEKIEELVENGKVNVFDKKSSDLIDSYSKPSLHIVGNQIYLKFSSCLNDGTGNRINFVVICVLDKEHNIIELRFDRVGIAYKNLYNFYRDKINEILAYLESEMKMRIENIDFKAVIDYVKSEKENISIYAQQMQRNGTTAYLEAYDDGDGVMPILGELSAFIEENRELFDTDINTGLIRDKLRTFIKEIEIKSDMPRVKVRLEDRDIKFGITHNYKGMEYSFFMFYGELLGGEEVMNYVRNYLIECSGELEELIQSDSVSE